MKEIKKQEADNYLKITNPFNQSVFPPEINAPTFIWNDTVSNYKAWHVFLSDTSGKVFYTTKINDNQWTPYSSTWNTLKESYLDQPILFIVVGIKKGFLGLKNDAAKVTFSISSDSVGAPIFYRAVPLPFSYAVKNVHEIEWYMGKVGDEHTVKMLDNIPVCANCHSFPKKGDILAMDVDYANDKGSYTLSPIHDSCMINKEDIISWSDYRRSDGENTFGLLSQISPDGRYAVSTVKDRSVFVAIDENFKYSQLFFPIKGILAYYDKVTNQYAELNGACDKNFVQSNPSWSPDGKEIVFARSTRYYNENIENSSSVLLTPSDAEEFISGTKDFKFDLYRIKFNEGRGSKPEPVQGASNNGKSNFFARYSPDGKWIVFCQADNFMLLQEDSKLYIVPSEGGTPRLMRCNTEDMNSWHSWSPNSRWLVFSSKHMGPYTQLYLTHIDKDGMDSPPILLDNFVHNKRAANIPEFYNGTMENFKSITDNFSVTPLYYVRQAENNVKYNDYIKAFENLRKALELDSAYYEAYIARLKLNTLLKQTNHKKYINDYDKALDLISKEISKDPNNEELLLIRAKLYMSRGENDLLLRDAGKVLKLNNKSYIAYGLYCKGLRNKKDWDNAIRYYKKYLELKPENEKEITSYLVEVLKSSGRKEEALKMLIDLIEKYPSSEVLYLYKAFLEAELGHINQSFLDIEMATSLSPDKYTIYIKRADLYKFLKRENAVSSELRKALVILDQLLLEKTNDIELLFERANVYSRLNDVKKALNDYNSILQILPENYSALKYAVKIEISRKNWNKILTIYETLIKNYNPEPEFYINTALAYIQINNLKASLSSLNKGASLFPEYSDFFFYRGKLYDSMKEEEKAKSDYNKFISQIEYQQQHGALNKQELTMYSEANERLKSFN